MRGAVWGFLSESLQRTPRKRCPRPASFIKGPAVWLGPSGHRPLGLLLSPQRFGVLSGLFKKPSGA